MNKGINGYLNKSILTNSKLVDLNIKKLEIINNKKNLENIGEIYIDPAIDVKWESYKKKRFEFMDKKKEEIPHILILNKKDKFLKNLFFCLLFFKKIEKLKNYKNYILKNNIFKELTNIYVNNNFLKLVHAGTISTRNKKIEAIIIIVDLRPMKIRMVCINKNKCILSLTTGILYKKLKLNKKNLKKSQKMVNLMIKTFVKAIKLKFSKKKHKLHHKYKRY